MGDLSMLNLTNIPKDRSGYGSRLTVLDLQRDKKIEYTLVSTRKADAEKASSPPRRLSARLSSTARFGDEIEVVHSPSCKVWTQSVGSNLLHAGSDLPRFRHQPCG